MLEMKALTGYTNLGISLIIGLFIWLIPYLLPVRGVAGAFLNILIGLPYAVFVYFIIMGLLRHFASQVWVYRVGFIVGSVMAGVQSIVLWLGSRFDMVPYPPPGSKEFDGWAAALFVGSSLLGCVIGALMTTSPEAGLWENNSPPPAKVKQEVFQRHLEVIGIPGEIPWAKRSLDVIVSAVGLLISFPIWVWITLLIWFENPGPVPFLKNSVGKGGVNFHQFKFRTMVRGAEESTGPVLSELDDERVLFFGRILRKTALDELPQLINILKGEMSFVGPRPQRTVLVRDYLVDIPEYAERHSVPPGLAGLAQVAGSYYLTPRQKLRFDRLYIHHISLGFDLKLVLLAFLITFVYRWKKDWDGRLPRNLLH